MKFYEYGDKDLPHIMLIHGTGWSYWLYLRQARLLQNKYQVILPVIDGHGEEGSVPYVSTEKTSDKIIEYIDKNCGGKLFAIGGVSLGGQVVIELLSRRKDIAKKAIVESGLCISQPSQVKRSKILYKLFGKILFSRSFNKLVLKMLPEHMQLPKEIAELFLRDIIYVKSKTMSQVFQSYFQYTIKESLKESQVDAVYWHGSKELECIKESAKKFKSYIKEGKVIEFDGYDHAEISTYRPEEWVEKAEEFFKQ